MPDPIIALIMVGLLFAAFFLASGLIFLGALFYEGSCVLIARLRRRFPHG